MAEIPLQGSERQYRVGIINPGTNGLTMYLPALDEESAASSRDSWANDPDPDIKATDAWVESRVLSPWTREEAER